MKKQLGSFTLLLLFIIGCSQNLSMSMGTYIPEGKYSYHCTAGAINSYSWQTELEIGGTTVTLAAWFNDISPDYDGDHDFLLLAEGALLWISKSGELITETNKFKESVFVQNYPGGYNKFVSDLNDLNINWVGLHNSLFETWKRQYKIDSLHCHPPKPMFLELNVKDF